MLFDVKLPALAHLTLATLLVLLALPTRAHAQELRTERNPRWLYGVAAGALVAVGAGVLSWRAGQRANAVRDDPWGDGGCDSAMYQSSIDMCLRRIEVRDRVTWALFGVAGVTVSGSMLGYFLLPRTVAERTALAVHVERGGLSVAAKATF